MSKLTIEPSQYSRSDGIIMNKLPSGSWVICRGGGCFFFDKTKMDVDPWVFKAANSIQELEVLGMSFGAAYRFLEVIPPKEQVKRVPNS